MVIIHNSIKHILQLAEIDIWIISQPIYITRVESKESLGA